MKVKPAYWLWPLALWMILWMPEARAGNWGGTSQRTAAAIDLAGIRQSVPDSNYGAAQQNSCEAGNPTPTVSRHMLIRMASDPRTGGYNQDICTLFIYYDAASSDPSADADSLRLYGHVIRRNWVEGNEVGQTADSGDCDWNAAITKSDGSDSVAWGTDGALSTTTDIYSTVACSSIIIINSTPSGYLSLPISSTWLTEDFFDYGLAIRVGWSDVNYQVVTIYSDNSVTEAYRPYFSGWESQAGATALKIGTTQLGTVKLGP